MACPSGPGYPLYLYKGDFVSLNRLYKGCRFYPSRGRLSSKSYISYIRRVFGDWFPAVKRNLKFKKLKS